MCLKEMAENHRMPIFFNDFVPTFFHFSNQIISLSKTRSIFRFQLNVCPSQNRQMKNTEEFISQGVIDRFSQGIEFMRDRLTKIEFNVEDQDKI